MIFQKQIRIHRLKPFNLDNRKKILDPRLDQKESNTGDNPLRALSVNAGEGGFFGGFPVAVCMFCGYVTVCFIEWDCTAHGLMAKIGLQVAVMGSSDCGGSKGI